MTAQAPDSERLHGPTLHVASAGADWDSAAGGREEGVCSSSICDGCTSAASATACGCTGESGGGDCGHVVVSTSCRTSTAVSVGLSTGGGSTVVAKENSALSSAQASCVKKN